MINLNALNRLNNLIETTVAYHAQMSAALITARTPDQRTASRAATEVAALTLGELRRIRNDLNEDKS